MCKCLLYHCHRVSAQLQLTNISISISSRQLAASDWERAQAVKDKYIGLGIRVRFIKGVVQVIKYKVQYVRVCGAVQVCLL